MLPDMMIMGSHSETVRKTASKFFCKSCLVSLHGKRTTKTRLCNIMNTNTEPLLESCTCLQINVTNIAYSAFWNLWVLAETAAVLDMLSICHLDSEGALRDQTLSAWGSRRWRRARLSCPDSDRKEALLKEEGLEKFGECNIRERIC